MPGNAIEISGSGSQADPYIIDSTGNIAGTVQFIPSQTVLWNVVGQGTELSPIQVQANADVSMTELTDVLPGDIPAEGEVPVWTTDHWEFKIPASAPPGTVNVGAGLGGDGSAGNPLRAMTSGIWGQGAMLSPPWPSNSTVGIPIYVDSAGALRAKPYATTYIPDSTMHSVVPASGWRLDSSLSGRWGGLCFVAFGMTRTGSALVASATGNIGNVIIANLAASLPAPYSYAAACFQSGEQGVHVNVVLRASDRAFILTNLPPNYAFPVNGQISVTGFYMTGMEVRLPDGTLTPTVASDDAGLAVGGP